MQFERNWFSWWNSSIIKNFEKKSWNRMELEVIFFCRQSLKIWGGGGQVVMRCNMPVEIIKLLGISNDFWWKLGLNLISKKIACISLVEILKLVRISLKNKNESHVCTLCTYFIYDSHFTTFSLGHCPKSRYIHFGKRVNYNLGRLVNFGIKTENPS